MPFDIDRTMLVYLGMITAGIFFIAYPPPYYLALGLGLIVVGGILVLHKSRKKELGTKL
ncbi:hypothetical protein [Candidatus Nitrosotalea bavarica]|jgi:hypothetical protein|uniref:hypothetical protein n=1 Tax=Candidatus Nitrosotalea bavarica TaxID=1903277 RepID=UPI0013FD198E|nr:hypothetical protein [Candidatus Nitrosotalea bavarica]